MLIPGSVQHYRVRPEFEDLEDIDLEHLIFQAKERRDDAIWIFPLLSVIVAWIACFAPVMWLIRVFVRNTFPPAPQSPSVGGLRATELAALAIGAIAGFAGSLVVWIWIRRWLIVRSIRYLMGKASCPYCAFDLRGLPITDRTLVRCPECGELLNLSEMGLSRRDLAVGDGFGAARPGKTHLGAKLSSPEPSKPAGPAAKPRIVASPSSQNAIPRRTTPKAPPPTSTEL